MSAGRLVLLRHGRTEWNESGRLQGHADVPLDAVGRAQAEHAATTLARMAPALVVSSDLVRAAHTAKLVADAAGVPLRLDPALRERDFGVWDGLTVDEIAARYPAEHAAWRRGDEIPGVGAELRPDVGRRVLAAVEAAAEPLAPDDLLVVVSHGGALSTVITALLGGVPGDWFGVYAMANGRWSVLERNPRREPPWRLLRHDVTD